MGNQETLTSFNLVGSTGGSTCVSTFNSISACYQIITSTALDTHTHTHTTRHMHCVCQGNNHTTCVTDVVCHVDVEPLQFFIFSEPQMNWSGSPGVPLLCEGFTLFCPPPPPLPWIPSSPGGEYFQRGWWEFLTARLLAPAWLSRPVGALPRSIPSVAAEEQVGEGGGGGEGGQVVSGGPEVIPGGRGLLLILRLFLLACHWSIDERTLVTWTFWSLFPLVPVHGHVHVSLTLGQRLVFPSSFSFDDKQIPVQCGGVWPLCPEPWAQQHVGSEGLGASTHLHPPASLHSFITNPKIHFSRAAATDVSGLINSWSFQSKRPWRCGRMFLPCPVKSQMQMLGWRLVCRNLLGWVSQSHSLVILQVSSRAGSPPADPRPWSNNAGSPRRGGGGGRAPAADKETLQRETKSRSAADEVKLRLKTDGDWSVSDSSRHTDSHFLHFHWRKDSYQSDICDLLLQPIRGLPGEVTATRPQ